MSAQRENVRGIVWSHREPRRLMRILLVAGLLAAMGTTAQAGPLLVAGSPGFDWMTFTGLLEGHVPAFCCVNDAGIAVGYANKFVSGMDTGFSAVRWDAGGTEATELDILGTTISGYTYAHAYAYAVNATGTAVGNAVKYDSGVDKGSRAVRWVAGGTAATELGNLGTSSSGSTSASANAVNAAGTAVGYARKYVSDINKGYRAVRWAAGGTAATELGNLGTDGSGSTDVFAYAVNAAGTAVGYARKYVNGVSKGTRAVRWGSLSTAATELGNLGTDGSGSTSAYAYAINATGTAVGYAEKYDSGVNKGSRAVRWVAGGTAATELGNLGTSSSGSTGASAYAVNATGTAVGYAEKYDSGDWMGPRAVRWDAGSTAATELGNLGTDSSGSTYSQAYAVNDVGTTVGWANKYVGGVNQGNHAVIWLPDASAVDLNDLGILPVSGGGTWTLTYSKALSADGYVAGEGTFDPDGAGPLASYTRLWVAQVGLGGTWTGGATTNVWGRGPNWSTGTPAMQVGNATFASTATVALDRNEKTKSIHIDAGTVAIEFNGYTLTTETTLDIAPGATLKGAGSIIGDVVSAGTLAPGNSPGTLNITGNLTSTGTLEFELASPSLFDHIAVSGTLSAGGTLAVKLLDGFSPGYGDTFDLADWNSLTDNGYTFDFSQAALGPGLSWDTSGFAATGSISVVPEPSTVALLTLAGLAGVALAWRRRAMESLRITSSSGSTAQDRVSI